MSDILTTLLNETRENGKLLARIDERVVGLAADVKDVQEKADAHHARLDDLESPGKARKYLIAAILTAGSVVGVAQVVMAIF